jgi:hypothetical protein
LCRKEKEQERKEEMSVTDEGTAEEYLRGFLESNGIDLESGFALVSAVAVAIIIVIVCGVMFFLWARKQINGRKLNAELSAVYDEYMSSDTDMDFEDYVFCKHHHIKMKNEDSARGSALRNEGYDADSTEDNEEDRDEYDDIS